MARALRRPGRFTAVSAGRWHSCALDDAGELTCWGGNDWGQSEAPEGSFAADQRRRCALLRAGRHG